MDSPRPETTKKRRKAANAAHRATKRPLKGREKHKVALTEQAARRREVGRLHLERIPQWEIAERMRVDEGTISRDLKAIRAEWRAEARSDVGEASERELRSLEASERRLRAAWDRVLEDRRMKPGLRAATECKINAELVRIAAHRAKILGLEAPAKIVHTGGGGGPIAHDVRAQVAVNPVEVILDADTRSIACDLLERISAADGGASRAPDERRDAGEALPGGPGALRVEGPLEARPAPREAEPPPP